MRLPTIDVNSGGTWQHKRKLHVFLQHLAVVLCVADLDGFQWFPREDLFGQGRREIVGMEDSEPLLGCSTAVTASSNGLLVLMAFPNVFTAAS